MLIFYLFVCKSAEEKAGSNVLPKRRCLKGNCIYMSNLITVVITYVSDVETNAGNQRVKVELHDPSVNSWDPATYCNPTSGPGQEEYHVLVKAGQM